MDIALVPLNDLPIQTAISASTVLKKLVGPYDARILGCMPLKINGLEKALNSDSVNIWHLFKRMERTFKLPQCPVIFLVGFGLQLEDVPAVVSFASRDTKRSVVTNLGISTEQWSSGLINAICLLLGLEHCWDPKCALWFPTCLAQIAPPRLCGKCRYRLRTVLSN